MKRYILLSLLACYSLQASSINFGYGENGDTSNTSNGQVANGSARSWTIPGANGFTVTVQAFSLSGGAFTAANTTQFGTAQSASNNLGLGVCNVSEQSNCTFNEWQVDDNAPGGSDFLLFTFSKAVNISNLVIQQTTVASDSDAAYFASNGLFTTPSTAWALTTDAGGVLQPGQSRTLIGPPGITGGIQTFLFGAKQFDGGADYFKLVSLDATLAPSAVPEPGSMALVGAGLIGLGMIARRRRNNA